MAPNEVKRRGSLGAACSLSTPFCLCDKALTRKVPTKEKLIPTSETRQSSLTTNIEFLLVKVISDSVRRLKRGRLFLRTGTPGLSHPRTVRVGCELCPDWRVMV